MEQKFNQEINSVQNVEKNFSWYQKMNDENIKKIAFYILIIAILFVFISIIVPWGTIDAKIGAYSVGQVDFYTFGVHATGGSSSEWSIFFDLESLKTIFSVADFADLELPFAMYIAIFPVILCVLIIGIADLLTFYTRKINIDLSIMNGLLVISTLFLFYIFVNFGLFSIPFGISLKPYFNFSMGFYFMLLSGIMFFASFFINKLSDNAIKK